MRYWSNGSGSPPRRMRPSHAIPRGSVRRQRRTSVMPGQSTDTTITQQSAPTDSAAKPASIPARGPPPGGSSRVHATPEGTRTEGGTIATTPASATSPKAQHTRSTSRTPPNTRSGFETPPRRSPPPPPTTIAARRAHGTPTPHDESTPLTPTARRSARPCAASSRPPSGRDQ